MICQNKFQFVVLKIQLNNPSKNRCYMEANKPCNSGFSLPFLVSKGQPLCLLEAMKMMSEIPAPCDCEITAVLKENGALVSFGEPLFRYQPC